jgi:hypothetical protein
MTDLSQLLQRIKAQLKLEYQDEEIRSLILDNMTVKQLLVMLEYMGNKAND